MKMLQYFKDIENEQNILYYNVVKLGEYCACFEQQT